jgi:hypothetical protein
VRDPLPPPPRDPMCLCVIPLFLGVVLHKQTFVIVQAIVRVVPPLAGLEAGRQAPCCPPLVRGRGPVAVQSRCQQRTPLDQSKGLLEREEEEEGEGALAGLPSWVACPQ